MDKIYMTAFAQGKANLDQMAAALNSYAPKDLGEYLGAAAMIPKLVFNPSYGKSFGFEDLTGLLHFLGETKIHVYDVVGENIADVALQLRQELGLRTSGLDRVHLARTQKELAVVEFAREHDSEKTAKYILEHFTEEDLKA